MSEVCEGLEVKSCTWCTFRNPRRTDCPNLELLGLAVYEGGESDGVEEFDAGADVGLATAASVDSYCTEDVEATTQAYLDAVGTSNLVGLEGLAEDVAEAYGNITQDEAVRTLISAMPESTMTKVQELHQAVVKLGLAILASIADVLAPFVKKYGTK